MLGVLILLIHTGNKQSSVLKTVLLFDVLLAGANVLGDSKGEKGIYLRQFGEEEKTHFLHWKLDTTEPLFAEMGRS